MTPEIRIGDSVAAYRPGGLTGDVISVGRVNVKIHTRVRFAPSGPWYDQTHTVPREQVIAVYRDGAFVYTTPEIDERLRRAKK